MATAGPTSPGRDTGGGGQGLYVSIQNDGSPFVTTQPVSVSGGGPGQPVEFTIDAEPAFFIQWQRAAAGTEDWTDIPGAEDPTLSVVPTVADQGARYRALVWTDDPELYLPMLSCPATLSLTLPATGPAATPILPIGALALLVLGLMILRLRHEHDRRDRTGSQRA